MNSPSEEQLKIIQAVRAGNNVIVNSVAGSGKTTTILHICQTMTNANILVIVYNSRLKIDTREKCKKYGITNTIIHSYHSFCKTYYDMSGYTDVDLKRTLDTDKHADYSFDIIILDEQQDTTQIYYNTTMRILNDNKCISSQLCLFGDSRQAIYVYNGADERYLELADKIYKSDRQWSKFDLTVSFRLTRHMVDFINNNCHDTKPNKQLVALKDGPKIEYIIGDVFKEAMYKVQDIIINYIYSKVYSYDEIFILAPSIKKSSYPIRRLENNLVRKGIKCFCSANDDANIEQDIIKNKVVFATFHQVKGLERKCVVLFNFDASYFDYFAKNDVRDSITNTLYVALTRASEQLVVIQSNTTNPMPFLIRENLLDVCSIENFEEFNKTEFNENTTIGSDIYKRSVTDLIKYCPIDILCSIHVMIEYMVIKKSNEIHRPTKKIYGSGATCEIVSDINGIAIPAIYQYRTSIPRSCSILIPALSFWISHGVKKRPWSKRYIPIYDDICRRVIKIKDNFTKANLEIDDFLFLANLYQSSRTGFINNLYQINKYNWLNEQNIEPMLELMKQYISCTAKYEYTLSYMISERPDQIDIGKQYEIGGSIDILDDNTVWEIKCVKDILPSHIIQLAIYACMYKSTKHRLLNILTGEIIEIVCNDNLSQIISLLVFGKKKERLDDDEFCKALT